MNSFIGFIEQIKFINEGDRTPRLSPINAVTHLGVPVTHMGKIVVYGGGNG